MKKEFKNFIGRANELQRLKTLYARPSSSIAVIKGRRRIGKSRLVAEFAQKFGQARFLSFTGLPPYEATHDQAQRDHFGWQIAQQLDLPVSTFRDWSDALHYLSHHLKTGDIVLFDEISWMGAYDPTFVPKLKAWWDTELAEKIGVLLVFCGSVSTWIEENILNSTAFYGRIALTMTLAPLSISESTQFLRSMGFKGSAFDIYKLLALLGGIPWYLEQINPEKMAEDNIKELCFHPEGLLVIEFDRIFHDLFNGKGATYKAILHCLNEGMRTQAEIREAINYPQSGTLSQMLNHLITAGFVQEHMQWSFKTGKRLKQSLYRISDPYIRFYLKTIDPQRVLIMQGAESGLNLTAIKGFDAYMGLQVENLLLQNRSSLLKAMGLNPSDGVYDGPYRQSQTTRQRGCQVDYLVQTESKNLFLCEFKFKIGELGREIIDEMKEKMSRLSVPHGFAIVPVLFHIGGVTEPVYDARYFYRIIDIADFLEN